MSDATTALAAAQAAAASSSTASDAADFAAEKAVEVNADRVAAQTAKNDAQAAAAAAGAQMWVGGEAVTTATVRQAPDGSRIRSNAARTTRATFDATEQGFWTPVLSTAGTLEQVALSTTYVGKPTTDLGDWALLRRDTSDVTKGVAWTTPSATVARALGYLITTDYASVQAAIDAVPQTGAFRGGTVWIPPGSVSESGQWDLRQKENITVAGSGAMSRSYSPTLVTFTRSDSTSCALLGSSNSVKFKGFRLETSNSAYSGKIIDTGASVVADCQMFRLEDMGIKAAGTSATLVSLLHSVGASISRSNFSGGGIAVRGNGSTTGYAIAQSYAINVTIDGECQFGNHATAAIYNPSIAWNIHGNIFSPGPGGVANAISTDAVTLSRGLNITGGNYFGDASSGTYIKVAAQGAVISGNYIDGDGATGIFVSRPTYALDIIGNDIRMGGGGVGIDFDPNTGASPSLACVVQGNMLNSSTTKVQNHTAVNMKVALIGNYGVSDLNPNNPEFSQGFTVGTAATGTSFASNGDITMQTNRVLKGYKLGDTAGTQVSVYLAGIAGQGLTVRSDVATRTPLVSRAHASQSVDAFLVENSDSSLKHLRVTSAGATISKVVPLTKTTNYTAGADDTLIITNGATVTITLPDPTVANTVGRSYRVKNINAASATVSSAASKTIDGAASDTLAQWAVGTYVSDGSNWLKI